MNTKGIKFLAVLAVMVMAFAAIVALAPADNDVVAIDVNADNVKVDPTVITSTDGYTTYYISDDTAVKVESVAPGTTIYVQNGKELELDFKNNAVNAITVKSVTSDIERHTTSTVDGVVNTNQVGKIVLDNSELTFVGEKGQSVIYTAMEPKVKTSFTTSVIVEVTTDYKYATVSSDTAFDGATTVIGANVTIADNQFIEVEGALTNVTPYYGVKITDAPASSNGTVVTTFYASGMNAGSFNMEEANDAVAIINGSVNAKNGTASIKASNLYTFSEVTITRSTSADQLTLTGSIYSGDVVANGTVAMGGTSGVTIDDYATLTLSNGSTATGTVVVEGTLVLKCMKTGIAGLTINGTGIVKADNKDLWTYSATNAPSIALTGTFSGLVDVYTITEVARVTDRFSTAEIAPDQTFRVVGDTTVTNSLKVYGILIIDEGVTVTINKVNGAGAAIIFENEYSQLINNGTILIKTAANGSNEVGLQVHGGLAVNYGKIDAKSDANSGMTFGVDFPQNAKGIGFINYGDITISKNDVMKLTDRFVNEGSLTLSGSLATAVTLKNGGIFTLSNATINNPMTVQMSKGAEFNVVSAKFTSETAANNLITVANYGPNEDTGATEIKSSIAIAGVNAAQIRGIDIIDSTTVKSTGTTYKLNLDGNVGVSGLTGTNKVTMTLGKGIEVKDSANVSKGYEMAFETGATLAVSGEMVFADGVTVSEQKTATNLTLTATGTVMSMTNDILDNCKLSGAKYSTVGSNSVFYYTSMDAAIVGAVAADVNLIEVGSKGATITTSTIIPSGMVITEDANTAVLSIGDSDNMVEVLVESDVAFSFTKHVKVVNGAIIMANVNDLDDSSVDADVKEVDSESNAAAYMSLGYALANAESGDEITICQKVTLKSETLVIPEGVVVDTVGSNVALVLIDSNLEVDGTLMVQNFYFVANTDDNRYITVDGAIMDYDEDGAAITPWWYTPIGVSYKLTLLDDNDNEHTWYVITNLDRLQEAINIADDAKVTVEGDAVLGEITISGRDDVPAEVTFNGDVTAETLILDDAIIIAKQGNEINATFANALGSITITGAYVKSTTMSIYSLDDGVVTMTGAIRDDVSGTYGIEFDGITAMDNATIGWGFNNVYNETPVILFNGVTDATGRKNLIQQYDETGTAGFAGYPDVYVNGVLNADNGSKLIIDADVNVVGALTAAERTEEAVAGTINVNGNIFVGMLESDIYDYDAFALTSTAVLSGKIILESTNDDPHFIYVDPEATVDPTIVEDLDTMNIFVDDEVWFTLYGVNGVAFTLNHLVVPMFNAAVAGVYDEALNTIKVQMVDGNVIKQLDNARTLTSYGNIYITLDYDIFEVKIKTDGSVKAVYIDGILMETGQSMNIFTMMNVAAGTHKVTVEAATGYDADKCVLYTEMGTILPNMGFTFTELDVTEYDFIIVDDDENMVKVPVVVYNINGTEIQPEPVPPTPEEESQWTITTILLVILVVLIAIMAVIVALRLNRS